MIPFSYQRISKTLIADLHERLLVGESLILLGARNSGKRQAMQRLCSLLEKTDESLIQLQFLTEIPLTAERQLQKLVHSVVAATNKETPSNEESHDSFWSSIDWLTMTRHRPVLLFAANVDALAHHLARQFLQGVRTRVQAGHLIAVLSGEGDLRDLVHGPNSEFNCANQIVIQGYTEEEFADYLSGYSDVRKIELWRSNGMIHSLWQLTGGNLFALRLLLGAVEEPLEGNDISALATQLAQTDIFESPLFYYASQYIARKPDCWTTLERLIEGKIVDDGLEGYAPNDLEFAGIAIREIHSTSSHLQFASPLMEAFCRRYYDARRFGDLYAGVASWDEAFKYYVQLEQESTVRPSGVNDVANVEAVVNALCAALQLEATTEVNARVESLKNLFIQGCRHILGFSEVSFWLYDFRKSNAGWQHLVSDGVQLDRKIGELISHMLPVDENLSPGILPLTAPLNRYGLAAIVPALLPTQKVAVVISNLGNRVAISRERERLSRTLLTRFINAYSHTLSFDALRLRLQVRQKHLVIANTIFNALGSHVRNVSHVLTMASRGLRELGYRRVMFCLVDPEVRRIQGVLDSCEGTGVDLARMIDYPLDNQTTDLQPYVINTRKPMIVEDAKQQPIADQRLVRAAHLEALAIVPILNLAGEAIGTIHVERKDRVIPSGDEVDDLTAFGRQLAIAIEQSERVNLLESALDKIPEPIVIVDRMERTRYINRPAAELFNLQEGWQERGVSFNDSPQNNSITYFIRESLSVGHRLVSHVEGIGKHPRYKGEVLADVIQDWRGKTAGGFLRIQDINYLDRVFKAAQLVAEATDLNSAMRNLLNAAKLLGHHWGRLYLVEQGGENSDKLISRLSFGYANHIIEKEFGEGKLVLSRHGQEGQNEWLCIDERRPIVFCWLESVSNGEQYVTPQGLRVINSRNPLQSRHTIKRPNDFWIDFPLIAEDQVLGKLSLQCNEDLRPEDFELLKMLSEIYADLFGAFLNRARDVSKREESIRVSVAEKTVAALAHNLATRLAAMPVVLSRYRLLEKKHSELKPLNEDFSLVVGEALNTVTRAKELLRPVAPRLSLVDLPEQIERTLKSSLPEGTWTLECSSSPLEVEVDPLLFGNALLELVQNTQDATIGIEQMHISLKVDDVDSDSETNDWVKIVYKDNGPGIPSNIREHIFEDFFSYRPQRKTSTGLGMGFIRRVIEAHGGRIDLGDDIHGAEFVIMFPKSSASKSKGK